MECEEPDEYVRIDNVGGSEQALGQWRLVSLVGPQTYVFPAYVLGPGASVYVHSGPDAPAASEGNHLLWTRSYIWNNDGDTAQLIDAAGAEVDRRACP